MTVLAAASWRSNAELIADAVVPLGYIKPTDHVIDVTYGRGIWWKKYQHPPARFTGGIETLEQNELAAISYRANGVFYAPMDYRSMPAGWTNQFDVVAYDPPYVAMGGRKTSTIPDFMERFGLESAAANPEALFVDNMHGLRECVRITKPGGLILHKTANYISSGNLVPQVHLTFQAAKGWMKLKLVAEFTMVGHARPQPTDGPCKACGATGQWLQQVNAPDEPIRLVTSDCPTCDGSGRIPRRVVHPRQNASTLFVFRKARR